jgi:hypothetical protein
VKQQYLGNASDAIKRYLTHSLDGAIDAKIASWRSASIAPGQKGPMLVTSYIINGPTVSPASKIEPFRWSTADYSNIDKNTNQHRGHPDEYNFDWVQTVDSLSPPPAPRTVTKQSPTWTVVIVVACVVGTIVIALIVYKAVFAKKGAVPDSVAETLRETQASESLQHRGGGGSYRAVEVTSGPRDPLIK